MCVEIHIISILGYRRNIVLWAIEDTAKLFAGGEGQDSYRHLSAAQNIFLQAHANQYICIVGRRPTVVRYSVGPTPLAPLRVMVELFTETSFLTIFPRSHPVLLVESRAGKHGLSATHTSIQVHEC